jgi:hypothetical protein
MKMQRVKRDNQAAWEKRDREAEKKDTGMKMKAMEMETKAAQNEMREGIKAAQNETRAERKLMKMQAAMENERRDRKDLETKVELTKMQAAHALENEKRDRMLENEKRDRGMLEKDMNRQLDAIKANQEKMKADQAEKHLQRQINELTRTNG